MGFLLLRVSYISVSEQLASQLICPTESLLFSINLSLLLSLDKYQMGCTSYSEFS